MDNDKPVIFPPYIDNPPQFLFLEVDDIVPMIVGMMAGVLLRLFMQSAWGMIIGIVLGAVFMKIYINFKRNSLPGTFLHVFYAITGIMKLNNRFKNGLIKRIDN